MSRSKYEKEYYLKVRSIVKMYLVGRYGPVIIVKEQQVIFNLFQISSIVTTSYKDDVIREDMIKLEVSDAFYAHLMSDERMAISLELVLYEFFCEAFIAYVKGARSHKNLSISILNFYEEYEIDEDVFPLKNMTGIWYRKSNFLL